MGSQRPNILIITTDQQRTDSVSCYGATFTQTPGFDRLASEGVLFGRAYCTNPVCTPSRASLFTGRHLSRHGAWNVGVSLPESEKTVADHLVASGYRSHYIGKAHFQPYGAAASIEAIGDAQRPNPRYPGFRGPYYGFETVELALGHTNWGVRSGHYAEWVRSQVSAKEFAAYQQATALSRFEFGGEAYDWCIPLRYHNSVWTADRTVEFLQKQDGAKPFLLAVGFQDPHHPHCVPTEFADRLDPDRVPLPDFVEGELDDKPPHFRDARCGKLEESSFRGEYWVAGQTRGADYRLVTARDARLGRAYYYALVKLIDQQMGRILDCLDRTGLARDTLIIVTSDHGELLGDHGLWMKGPFHYEQLVRVPLIVRWPGGMSGGKRTEAVFSQVHIAPTILAAAGLPCPDNMDGINALPLLRGESGGVPGEALIECVDSPRGLRLKTLVNESWKLTWYCGQSFGELYDLRKDPGERVNLWTSSDHAGERETLLRRLLECAEKLEKRAPRLSYA